MEIILLDDIQGLGARGLRVRVADIEHCPAGSEIQIGIPFRVIDIGALCPLKDHGHAAHDLHVVFCFNFFPLLAGHRDLSSYVDSYSACLNIPRRSMVGDTAA